MTSKTAYIDMEFAGIYGTRQGVQIPIEIGVVLHEPDTDTLSFTGTAFSRPVDVELWKNVTDTVGKRIDGQRRVFNLASRGHTKTFDKKFHLAANELKEARRTVAMVYKDLRSFMRTLNIRGIGTLVFFAQRREMDTFREAGIRTEGFLVRDLQSEIRSRYHLKEHVSLDRVSLVADLGITKTSAGSAHFTYEIPEKYRYLIKPHKAMGDAVRMFLVDREYTRYPEEFGLQLRDHLREYQRRKENEETARDQQNGQV
jgi:hypothetical protein